jgi:hypothetical protein
MEVLYIFWGVEVLLVVSMTVIFFKKINKFL